MKFRELLAIVGNDPLFETGLLLAGDVNPNNVRRQLSRWTRAGKLYQLRRGLYALAPPYQKTVPHPFLIANRLVRASYVSLQAALAYYGLIPEYVPVVTNVTTGRPIEYKTPLGDYTFRHIKQDMFHGYHLIEMGNGQSAFIAAPEKALFDQVHLQPGGDKLAYLQGLRLQNLERLNITALKSPKQMRAASAIKTLAERESAEYEILPGRQD